MESISKQNGFFGIWLHLPFYFILLLAKDFFFKIDPPPLPFFLWSQFPKADFC